MTMTTQEHVSTFIVLKVITPGEDIQERFNLHQPVRVVFNRALQAVGGAGHADQFTLEYRDQVLELDRTIGEYAHEFGWCDGTELELVPRPEVI